MRGRGVQRLIEFAWESLSPFEYGLGRPAIGAGRSGATAILLACTALACTGCPTVGPVSIPGDRFNYNKAGAGSANEQVLLNIIRLRYGEPIYFLEIASMLSQYTLEAGGELGRLDNNIDVWNNPYLRAVYQLRADPATQDTWGVNLRYSDRPTISYAPLQGEAFAKRVMSPIPPSTIFYLSQSGWSIDRLLECCVQRLNRVRNAPIHDIGEADFWDTVKFKTVASLLKKIQDAGRLELLVEVDPYAHVTYLYPPHDQEDFKEEGTELVELLDIPENTEVIKITTGGAKDEENELVMVTRSLLGMLNALAQAIIPPEEHIKSGQVMFTYSADDSGVTTRKWLEVSHSPIPVPDAFVQVHYNGHWWYIPKTDWNSKRTFGLIAYLFNLQATETGMGAPLVTVPAGGGG
jgi:hypothetical protein